MTVPNISDASEPSKRTLANKQNALKSTGPRTSAGKHRVAMNAFKHGLSGQNLCLQADESVPYFDLALRYIEDLRPVGIREEQLAQKVIDGNWRLNRASAIENNLLNNDTVVEAYRLKTDDERSAAMAGQANAWRSDCSGARALESLGRHEARIVRTPSKMTAEFDALQARRSGATTMKTPSSPRKAALGNSSRTRWLITAPPKMKRKLNNNSSKKPNSRNPRKRRNSCQTKLLPKWL